MKQESFRKGFLFLRDHHDTIYVLGAPILIVFASLAYYFSYYLKFIDIVDEGFLVNGALRVLEGQVPLADFWSYPPGRYYVLAGLFHVFGVNVAIERIMWIILMTVRNILVYTVSRRLLSQWLSLPVVLSIMLIPGPWHKTLYSFLMFTHMFVVFKYIEKPTVHRALLIGIVAGLTFYFRQDYAFFSIVMNLVAVIGVHVFTSPYADLADRSGFRRGYLSGSGKHIKWMLLATVLSIIPLLLFYGFQENFTTIIRRIGPETVRVVGRVHDVFHFPSLFKLAKHFIRWPIIFNEWSARAWFPYFVLFILAGSYATTIVLFVKWLRGKTSNTKQLIFLVIALAWTTLSSYAIFLQPVFSALLVATQSSWIMAAFLWHSAFVTAKDLISRKNKIKNVQFTFLYKVWKCALFIVLSIVIGFSWYFFLYYGFKSDKSGSITIAKGSRTPFKVARAHLMLPPREAKKLRKIIAEIRSRTSKRDTIFVYRYPMLYFLSERRNATKWDNIMAPAVIDQEAAIFVQEFRDNPPQLQIIDLSSKWLSTIISEYPCDAQYALFNNYRAATVRIDHLFLELHQGSNAWETVQKEFAKHDFKLRRALDCRP